jgi:hypothetical protein
MARKVLVRLVDDLDGLPSDDVSTVTFALDQVTYQIDLSKTNADRLRDRLAGFIGAARRTGGRVSRGATGTRSASAAGAAEAPAVREWARQQGHTLSDRGRIPASIVADYRAAQEGGARNGTVTSIRAKSARPKATPVAGHVKTAAAAKSGPAKATATAAPKRGKAAAGTAPATAPAAKPAAKSPRTVSRAAASKPAAGKSAVSKSAKAAAPAKATAKKATPAKATAESATPAKATRTAKSAGRSAAARSPKPTPRRAAAGKTRG